VCNNEQLTYNLMSVNGCCHIKNLKACGTGLRMQQWVEATKSLRPLVKSEKAGSNVNRHVQRLKTQRMLVTA
jgi:hypothetical protein